MMTFHLNGDSKYATEKFFFSCLGAAIQHESEGRSDLTFQKAFTYFSAIFLWLVIQTFLSIKMP